MKTHLILSCCLLALTFGMSSCDDNDKENIGYPVTANLGERTCTGKLVALPNPPDGSDEPIVPGTVMGLETDTEKYLLTFGGKWAWEESATVGGVVYTLGERVGITGTAKRTKISASEEYLELEAGKIEKRE